MEETTYYTSIIQSPQFTFLVGKDQTPMTIHASIVQEKSDPLSAMIGNGLMKESTTGLAILDDVDVDVFGGLCEHLYTGRYTTPICTANDFGETHPEDGTVRKSRFPWILHINRPVIRSNEPWPPSFQKDDMRHAQLCISYYLSVRFRKLQFDDCRCASYTPSPDIIYHARLYALATRFLVESLREQCLASLHQDLRQLIDKTSDINLIIDLLNVTYSITGKSEPGGGSPLRELVSHYAASKAPELAKHAMFRELLESFSEIGADILMSLTT
ncbi:uncharacterized protein ASPGLDRAFT_27348 [Aspergillus glaucus CBS 516.65]|uniref:BTB domain-containing protein n=1 Tax=Aspergillus glaucus CBS 516.65 TaxID=1160497 RepID=A0A1L9VF43_ASPGL|nr:hypothetical protein ASPGLDRAFT_27348 [Aspergillus glaucus CBS 516.65]OJJ82514.1 hypothetical protein ASPGLDRAFT_27348 [Aspergillus glaucus CBS 516.65]